jgi:hypothetical protein
MASAKRERMLRCIDALPIGQPRMGRKEVEWLLAGSAPDLGILKQS